MVLVSPAYAAKSEDIISTATGVWAANFERLRETKDLSPLAHCNSAHAKLSRNTGELFGRISKVRLASPGGITTQTTQYFFES